MNGCPPAPGSSDVRRPSLAAPGWWGSVVATHLGLASGLCPRYFLRSWAPARPALSTGALPRLGALRGREPNSMGPAAGTLPHVPHPGKRARSRGLPPAAGLRAPCGGARALRITPSTSQCNSIRRRSGPAAYPADAARFQGGRRPLTAPARNPVPARPRRRAGPGGAVVGACRGQAGDTTPP